MSGLLWAALFGSVAALLFRFGNRLYLRLAGGESLTHRYYVGAIGLTGVAAGMLFCALFLLMSLQDPDFPWTPQAIAGTIGVAAIVGLFVAGATAAKIYALRKLKRAGVVDVEEIEPKSTSLP